MVTRGHEESGLSRPDTTDAGVPRLMSCCQEELVDLELEALQLGGERARADGTGALRDMAAIAEAATRACDRALVEQYTPLDEAKFREVFTLAWCAGYHVETSRTRSGETSAASHLGQQ
jgi:hypothetical protein